MTTLKTATKLTSQNDPDRHQRRFYCEDDGDEQCRRIEMTTATSRRRALFGLDGVHGESVSRVLPHRCRPSLNRCASRAVAHWVLASPRSRTPAGA